MTRCTAAFLCKTEQRRDRSCPPSAWTKRPCGNLSQEPCVSVAEGEGCEPPEGLNGFQARRIQPLCLPYLAGLFVGAGPSFRTRCTGTRACTSRALLTPQVNRGRPPPEHKKAPAAIIPQEPCVSVAEGEGFEPPEGLNGFQARRMQPLCRPYRLVRLLRPVSSGHTVRAQGLHVPGLACAARASRLRAPRGPAAPGAQKTPLRQSVAGALRFCG